MTETAPSPDAARADVWLWRARFFKTRSLAAKFVDEGRIRFADTPDAVLAHSEELLALGVNVPRSTTLMNALSAQGLYAGPTVRNVAGAAAALKEVLA